MNSVAKNPDDDLKVLFSQVSVRCGLSPAIVEKDFWVCWMLDYLFTRSPWKTQLAFKGGTSLSKAYGLIKRFSEDIDLILDWRLLGYAVRPYAADYYPQLFKNAETQVYTVDPERTFWEKVTILHREAMRTPERGPMPSRYSRHYYDLWCMIQAGTKDAALKKLDLLDEVVSFKRKFYRCSWARYEQANAEEGT